MKDFQIRSSLLDFLNSRYGDDDTVVVEELGLCHGESRADVAVVNGELTAYEIKSDRDVLDRLPKQAEVYGRCFDRVVIVVGPRLYEAALAEVPLWWGVMLAEPGECDTVNLTMKRRGRKNRGFDKYSLVQLLWRAEAASVAEEAKLAPSGTRMRRLDLWKLLAKRMRKADLAAAVRKAIKARGDWRSGPTPPQDGDSRQSDARLRETRGRNRRRLLSRVSRDRRH